MQQSYCTHAGLDKHLTGKPVFSLTQKPLPAPGCPVFWSNACLWHQRDTTTGTTAFVFKDTGQKIQRSISIRTEALVVLVTRLNVQNLGSCCANVEYWLLNFRSALEFSSDVIFLVWVCNMWTPRALKGPWQESLFCQSYSNPTHEVWKIWKHTTLFLNEAHGLSAASLHFCHIFLPLSSDWLSVLYMVLPKFYVVCGFGM